MDNEGISTACRYAFPPNSLSLCGPNKQTDLSWYTTSQEIDKGTQEILEQFSTLYPYLQFIAGENHIHNPFNTKVVEAYWIGNALLRKIKKNDFVHFLDDSLVITKKISRTSTDIIKEKITQGAVPNHAFHVMNIYKRTGHIDAIHTIQTMDACIINSGEITQIQSNSSVIVKTKPLNIHNGKLQFGEIIYRKLRFQGDNDMLRTHISIGNIVSYHWGYICQKLSPYQTRNLHMYNTLAMNYANSNHNNFL